MSDVLIIGYGEIGKSIEKLYEGKDYEVHHFDKDEYKVHTQPKNKYEIMHICIPFSETFIGTVKKYIQDISPELTIINSTVLPNTARIIYDVTKANIVHSPVIGIHPYLTEGIQTIGKIIGGSTNEAADMACKHFNSIGVPTEKYNNSDESEMAKLLSTTYYGWNIKFMQEVHKLCEEWDLDFDNVYKATNERYNEGYIKLGKTNVVRPVLEFMGEGYGGHCISPNAMLLHKSGLMEDVTENILKLGYTTKSEIKYKDETWLYSEYICKKRTSYNIAKECGVSGTTIRIWLENFGIERRGKAWSEEEKELLEELSTEMSFKEIFDSNLLNRTYDAIRIQASKQNLKSIYDSSERNEETKIKISCTLRDIERLYFDGYNTKEDYRLRNSENYKKWRASVFERDGYQCQNPTCKYCGNGEEAKLHAHHIKRWSNYKDLRFDVDNGITYCEDYHMKEAHRKKK